MSFTQYINCQFRATSIKILTKTLTLIMVLKVVVFLWTYCRTHKIRICLYIAYIACGSAPLYIKMLYFFLTVLALSAAATFANIKIRYDAKTPQFAIFGTRVICVFYSIGLMYICKPKIQLDDIFLTKHLKKKEMKEKPNQQISSRYFVKLPLICYFPSKQGMRGYERVR